MKKFIALLFVVAFAGFASAADRSGKFAIGYQEQADIGSNTNGNWSIKYGLSDKATFQALVGFDGGKNLAAANDKNINFGGRLLYDIVQNENSHFYTGLGVAYNIDDKNNNPLRLNVPLGFEFNFASLPEIGFSIEVGANLDMATKGGSKEVHFSSIGGNGGGTLANIGLGVHYYF